MFRRVFVFARPFGLAFAIFILLSLVLAIEKPALSVTRLWLDIGFPEPHLSILSGLLALALLLPHDLAKTAWMRWLLGGVLFGFFILVGATVIGYYHRLHLGWYYSTDLPMPFSFFVMVILLFEFARVSWWGPLEPKLPLPAWCFTNAAMIAVAFFSLILVHIVTFGRTDHRRKADAAVVLGAKVYDDGTPSQALRDRLDTGIELFEEGWVSYLIMSGGTGANDISEPQIMSRYAQERGVPVERILLDEGGTNTLKSARNCGLISRAYGFSGLLTVSQFFHCARVKLTFERAGTHCYTVPTCLANWRTKKSSRLSREDFFVFREMVAFPFYFLYYR